MISQWILQKLEPLKKEKLIILKDPQRIIRKGELIVDGWGEKNKFAVLLCTGNLYLRDNYERIRDDKGTKILLVDRTREDAKIKLFYPDIEAETKENCLLTLTLQDFLTYKTGDIWPPMVNDRLISKVIMDHPEGILKTHKIFRDINKTGFSDNDLYKIILGGVININPFKKLTPQDTRKICIEQHSTIEELKDYLPEEALEPVFEAIKRAPAPFSHLLEGDPERIIRAFTLAAIMHQHGLEYNVLINNIDPSLSPYQDISPEFLNQAMEEQLKSDADKISADILSVEEYLKENPDKLAFLLDKRLKVSDELRALEVLKREKLSPLIRSMAMISLLLHLLEKLGKSEYKNVIAFLEEEENSKYLPLALRRPGEEWNELTETYIKTAGTVELIAKLKSYSDRLKVTPTYELKFEIFDELWNKEKANRIEYYLSELERLLKVKTILPIPRKDFWPELGNRWDKAIEKFNHILKKAKEYQEVADTAFQDFYLNNYKKLINSKESPVIFTHQFLPRVLKPYWDPQAGQKAFILIFDGLRVDAWEEFLKPVFEEKFEVTHSFPGSAIVPTETQLSRKAISAGVLPENFVSNNEKVLMENWFHKTLGINLKLDTVTENHKVLSGISAHFRSDKVEVIIFNFSDKNLHGLDQPLGFIYNNIIREIIRQDVRSILKELPEDIKIFITSDHGFAELSPDAVEIPNMYTTEKHDVKFRVARVKKTLSGDGAQKCIFMDNKGTGIPGDMSGQYVKKYSFTGFAFPKPGYSLKRPGPGGGHKDRYSHGGLSLSECMIPMIILEKKDITEKPLKIVSIKPEGAFEEGKEIEIIITVEAKKAIDSDLTITLELNQDSVKPRKEIFTGKKQVYKFKWKPEGKPEEIDKSSGFLIKNVTAVGTYKYEGRTVRTSATTDVKVRMDTKRVRRRLNSKLDMIMGMIPKGLR